MEERVAMLLPDSPEWATVFFGSMKTGAVAVPLNTNLKPADYLYYLNDSRARVLVVDPSLLELVLAVRPQLAYLQQIVVTGTMRRGTCR
jgi:acyl-CoA synthetase (AMP-forming)/AMP-acid ligase II